MLLDGLICSERGFQRVGTATEKAQDKHPRQTALNSQVLEYP